jgi:hypothetical protein
MSNTSIDDRIERIKKLFARKRFADLRELREALGAQSRTTIFYALKEVGYLTSYSHTGRYYTLHHIPKFNEQGMWFVGDIRFSKHGTLRATIVALVHEAPAGQTHEELEQVLGLRVHDTLHSLVEDRLLSRERIYAVHVYLDPDPQRAKSQCEERQRRSSTFTPPPGLLAPPPWDSHGVIAVLVAVIQSPKDSARAIAAHLRAGGLAVTDEQVEAVFTQYSLGKKTAQSRSRRSRR